MPRDDLARLTNDTGPPHVGGPAGRCTSGCVRLAASDAPPYPSAVTPPPSRELLADAVEAGCRELVDQRETIDFEGFGLILEGDVDLDEIDPDLSTLEWSEPQRNKTGGTFVDVKVTAAVSLGGLAFRADHQMEWGNNPSVGSASDWNEHYVKTNQAVTGRLSFVVHFKPDGEVDVVHFWGIEPLPVAPPPAD